MTVKARCLCGAEFAAKDELAGKQVACPRCGQAFTVPAKAAPPRQSPSANQSIVARCSCGMNFRANASLVGKQVTCSACGQPFVVSTQAAPSQTQGNLLGTAFPNNSGGMGFGSPDPFGGPDITTSDVTSPYYGSLGPQNSGSALGFGQTHASYSAGAMSRPATHGQTRRRRRANSKQVILYVSLGVGGVCALLGIVGLIVPTLGFVLGYGLLVISVLAGVVGNFWVLGLAFSEDTMQGVFCFIVPFYSLYYFMTRFNWTLPYQLVIGSYAGSFVSVSYLVFVKVVSRAF